MYFFFHLITGIILGLLISDFLKDQRWFIPCAIGAVLPDLIGKPIGYLLFPTTIGFGRIYSHTLLITILIMIYGIKIPHSVSRNGRVVPITATAGAGKKMSLKHQSR